MYYIRMKNKDGTVFEKEFNSYYMANKMYNKVIRSKTLKFLSCNFIPDK